MPLGICLQLFLHGAFLNFLKQNTLLLRE
jgi:hypothetical protein